MSVNSSSADTPQPPYMSLQECVIFRNTMFILTAFSITNILLILPLSTLVLFLGCEHMRRQRCVSTTAAMAANPSDLFTYQTVGMETIGALGCLLFCVGVHTNLTRLLTCGFYLYFSTWCVKMHFHTLTCVERYLAVVHPVTYLGLKNRCGVRISNSSTACVWLLCFLWGTVMYQTYISQTITIYFSLVVFALIVVCFCCVSVLCVLRRPGPSEAGRSRERVVRIKRRAFNTVVAIMAALWLCLGGVLVCIALVQSRTLSEGGQCTVRASAIWFSLPSSLVLPLLYLNRVGKLPSCRKTLQ